MDVKQLAHRPTTTAYEQTPLSEVAMLMRKDNVGSVVITDEHGRVSGIVTDRDIAISAVADDMDPSTPVVRIMSRPVQFLYENADVVTAAGLMAENGFRRLPVLNTEGHLTGMISFDDLVVAFGDQTARLARAVRTALKH